MNERESWAVVTGAGTGIGRALALALVNRGLHVLGVGRRPEPLRSLQEESPDRITVIAADVAAHRGRTAIGKAVPNHCRVRFLIHNAALLTPVVPLRDIRPKSWRYHMAVNLEGPLFLTRRLLSKMEPGGRILHLSSGAAHSAYHGWGAYCTSKAALHMLYRCLDLELKESSIRVGSVRPGVVDTPMQDLVRTAPEEAFPDLPRFIALKNDRQLLAPDRVARFLTWLLFDTEPQDFAAEEWDIRNASPD